MTAVLRMPELKERRVSENRNKAIPSIIHSTGPTHLEGTNYFSLEFETPNEPRTEKSNA
jgi:hypothetical protein